MAALLRVVPCSSSCFLLGNFSSYSCKWSKDNCRGGSSPHLKTRRPRNKRMIRADAVSRQTWLPGLDPPPYLDGT
ncbi:hypothetical protein SUGI_1049400 [Cryptomeria japonica]|nr:hypothetical protein SUGI_1049400 [Cryptomeria japonica]